MCSVLMCDHQTITYSPNEIVKKLYIFSNMFSSGPIVTYPMAKVFHINLIHKQVHKRITIKNIISWLMNKKFILYLR